MTDSLQVVWPKKWIADAFAKSGIQVQHHYGIDVVAQTGPIWWATEHAARSMYAGNKLTLTAPNWMDFAGLPPSLFGRNFWISTIDAGLGKNFEAFVKIADSKCIGPGDTGKAMVTNISKWCSDCKEFGVPSKTVIILSEPVQWISEWRVWTDGKEILEMSCYRQGEKTWDEWPVIAPSEDLIEFARKAIPHVAQPCTMDIGILDNGRVAMVELNPAWSSGFYTSDMFLVYKTIAAACGTQGRKWEPDDWLRKKFENKGV